MCLPFSLKRGISRRIKFSNTAVTPMDENIGFLMPSEFTRNTDSFLLGIESTCYFCSASPADGPFTVSGNDMLSFSGHFFDLDSVNYMLKHNMDRCAEMVVLRKFPPDVPKKPLEVHGQNTTYPMIAHCSRVEPCGLTGKRLPINPGRAFTPGCREPVPGPSRGHSGCPLHGIAGGESSPRSGA